MPLNVSTRQPVRIGLLAPYRGTNLGDGAIHTALIDNLARRFESVEFVGINLDPVRTARLHNIRCHPITGLPAACYWLPSSALSRQVSAAEEPARDGRRALGILKRTIKAIPVLRLAARAIVRVARAIPDWRHEFGQLRSAFALARQLDLLIVAGSGQIDESELGGPFGHPYSLFRWAMLSRLAGTRMIVLSVGASPLPSVLGRLLIGTALACATYRSYRTAESKGRLSWLGFTRRDPCVPDLAFSLAIERYHHPPSGAGRVVGVSPISYGHPAVSPSPQPEVYHAYIRQLAAFVGGLAARGFEIVLFTSAGDEVAVQDLLARLRDSDQAPASLARVRTVLPSNVETLLTELAGVDYVVASRLHGVLLSHVSEKPVIAISFDSKVDAHMRDMGQSQYLAWIDTVTAPALERLFACLEQDSEQVRAAIAARRKAFAQKLAVQYDLVSTLAGPRVQPNPADLLVAGECE